ncbi:Ferredoxin, 2Fe-2S [Paraburkholderia tropica]|uniref:Rieske (2Fe-2S) protein n=1 Tax=Paraburkholderia tropica TaxID=92647 RepID=UPI001CAAC552|nr:Rieske 2Fe-2S domain-containing protein [Paraburkholderia tropica]CAG9200806.1 Ferredoxin, 2Fe-2S [Paraburkholderia tropica]
MNAATSRAVRLCHLDDLAPGASRGFDPHGSGRDTLFVIRRADHTASVDAWRNACPHYPPGDAVPLAWRKDRYLSADGRHIVCAGHGALFELASGVCVRGPCEGARLQRIALTLTEGGELWLSNNDSDNDFVEWDHA